MSINGRDLSEPRLQKGDELPTLKRWAARLVSYALDRLRVRHVSSYNDGYKFGYQKGLVKGRQLFENLDPATLVSVRPQVDQPDHYLFDDWNLRVDDALRDRVRRDVKDKLPDHKQPTKDQWEMIFSTTPSTCVVAGAGSGKSTTLVLRILLLHHYLGFELSSMTVVTFTAMSRSDFTDKLVETFSYWGIELQSAQVRRLLVRTFHSKILDFAKALPDLGDVQAFEFCKPGEFEIDEPDNDGDRDETAAFKTRLNEKQIQLLNQAYAGLYKTNERFRALIQILYERSIVLAPLEPSSDMAREQLRRLDALARADAACMDAVETAWRNAGAWPINGIDPTRKIIDVRGKQFQVHGTISHLGANIHVILGAEILPGKEFRRPEVKASLKTEMTRKRMLLSAYAVDPVLWISLPDRARDYLDWKASGATHAPGFDYKIVGELVPGNLLECFYGAGSFIENLALDVRQTIADMKFGSGNPDGEFFEALSLFWPTFEKTLASQQPQVMTFNRIFSLFGERAIHNVKIMPDSVIRSMSHLMIDEFQDISPQIVSWVRASLTEVRRRGNRLSQTKEAMHSSLLCVGDDWQSIYGWRGSAPKYFLQFGQEFPSPAITSVMLRENFRSHQWVVDAAEHIVNEVSTIAGKKARSVGPASANPTAVEIHDLDNKAVLERIREVYEAGNSVMVLYRRKSDVAAVRAGLANLIARDKRLPKKQQRLRLLTYHGSKGLEDDVVVMIGDCTYSTSSPYKNHAYLAARLGERGQKHPYDIAQSEEALRLAYVAITRAEKRCYWYLQPTATSDDSAASLRVRANLPFFEDMRNMPRKGTG